MKLKFEGLKNKIKDMSKLDLLVYLCIAVVAVIFFKIIWLDVMMVHDDMLAYLYVQASYKKLFLEEFAKNQGRIGFYIIGNFYLLPYMFENFYIYKLIQYGSIIFSLACLSYLVTKHLDKKMALLCALMFFAYAQVDTQHNLFISYILMLQIPIGILLLSIERLIRYYKSKEQKHLLIGGSLFCLSELFSESFVLFAIFFFILSMYFNIKELKKIKESFIKSLYDLRYHIILTAVYLTIYATWRVLHPSTYTANNFAESSNLIDSVKTIIVYTFGLFPLRNFASLVRRINLFDYYNDIFVIKAIFVALCAKLLIPKIKFDKVYPVILFSSLGAIIPNILFGFTDRHIAWVNRGTSAYTNSFFSYFFVILICAVVCFVVYDKMKYKTISLVVICIGLGTASFLTDLTNEYNSQGMRSNYYKVSTIENVIKSEEFSKIEDGSTIYMPDYIGVHGYMDRFNMMSNRYTNKRYVYINKFEEIDFSKQVYLIKYDSVNHFATISKINKFGFTNEISIVTTYSSEMLNAIIPLDSSSNIWIGNTSKGMFTNTAIINMPSEFSEGLNIKGENLDALNTSFAQGKLFENKRVDLFNSKGIYDKENWGDNLAYWSENEGHFKVVNRSNQPMKMMVKMFVATSITEESNFELKCNEELLTKTTVGTVGKEINVEILLKPGENDLALKSDGVPLQDKVDPRLKVFFVMNISVY